MVDQALVGCGIQFQPLQHLELGFRACRRTLLIRRLVGGTSGKQISPECLELDGIGAAGFGRVDQLQGKIERSVVVHSRLGNDEDVRHVSSYFIAAGRAADINTRFRKIMHDGRSRSDDAAGRDLDSLNYRCPGANHREAPDRDAAQKSWPQGQHVPSQPELHHVQSCCSYSQSHPGRWSPPC